MDDYPEHLAPARDKFGAIDEDRFDEWWAEASKFYCNVPEECARHWIFEHWGVSPYRSLTSASYSFDRQTWPSSKLLNIRSSWCRFDPENSDCREKGAELCKKPMMSGGIYPTAGYMIDYGEFPTPIVVLDNLDAHMSEEEVGRLEALPTALVLMEGHRRFNIALHLLAEGRLAEPVDVWFMRLK